MRLNNLQPALLAVLVAGCVHAGGGRCRSGTCAGEDRPPAAQPQPAVAPFTGPVDTEETIFPDPRERTALRMNAVRILIETYEEQRKALPPTFDAVLPREPRDQWVVDYEHDAWRRRFRYSTTGTKYELRSAGPDATFGTADDIVATKEVPAPNRWYPIAKAGSE